MSAVKDGDPEPKCLDSPVFQQIVASVELPRIKFELSRMIDLYVEGMKAKIAAEVDIAFAQFDINAEIERLVPLMIDRKIKNVIAEAIDINISLVQNEIHRDVCDIVKTHFHNKQKRSTSVPMHSGIIQLSEDTQQETADMNSGKTLPKDIESRKEDV